MYMRKKILSLLLAALLLLSLAACGSATADTTAEPQTTADAEADGFDEIVVVDNDQFTFKIVGIDPNGFFGHTLKVSLENKTNMTLMFAMDDVAVDGFMIDPLWAATLSAGMKSNQDISFPHSSLALCGITEPSVIQFTLDIHEDDNLEDDYLLSQVFTVQLSEDAAEPYVRTGAEGEIVLFDDENCTMIVTGFDPDGLFGYEVYAYLENKTDTTLMFTIDDAAVNGFMIDPSWACSVTPGNRAIACINWYTADLEANGITQVESLTMPIRVYDANDWNAPAFIEETFTVNP